MALGVKMINDQLEIIAPFSVEALFNNTNKLNQNRPKLEAFHQKVKDRK